NLATKVGTPTAWRCLRLNLATRRASRRDDRHLWLILAAHPKSGGYIGRIARCVKVVSCLDGGPSECGSHARIAANGIPGRKVRGSLTKSRTDLQSIPFKARLSTALQGIGPAVSGTWISVRHA